MIQTIQSRRKELEDWVNKLADNETKWFTEKDRCIKELEGFNLGVSLAQKEFLDFLIEINGNYPKNVIMILHKILELKQSLEVKDKELKNIRKPEGATW